MLGMLCAACMFSRSNVHNLLLTALLVVYFAIALSITFCSNYNAEHKINVVYTKHERTA